MTETTLPRRLHLAAALALCGLFVHFAFTLLYLTPPNPLKSRLSKPLNTYMEPHFQQRWSLFAPDRVAASRFVWFACRHTTSSGELEETPWHDMSHGLIRRKQQRLITPADRLHRAVNGGVTLALGPKRPLVEKLRENPDEFRDVLETIERSDRTRAALGQRLLARLASAHCDGLLGQGRTSEVRTRIVTVTPPPFSQRTAAPEDSVAQAIDLPWRSYERVAAL